MSIRIYRAARRFIPAGAGNTRRGAERGFQWAVHPRWRGEHQAGRLMVELERGSSPLARGTPALSTRCTSAWRFIPAGAGNTLPPGHQPRRTPVHPRWRGEHHHPVTGKQFESGSSPLARGTRQAVNLGGRRGRFIPAGAGNTASKARQGRAQPVHPRWRGEHKIKPVFTDTHSGSSPLARGTLFTRPRPKPSSRFIPAGAGNTSPVPSVMAISAVHPRWRGEHAASVALSCCAGGSSPLARGTLRSTR